MSDCRHCSSGRRDFIKIAFGASAAAASGPNAILMKSRRPLVQCRQSVMASPLSG